MTLFEPSAREWNLPGISQEAQISYDPGFLSQAEAQTLFQTLYQQLPWQGGSIKLFGKEVLQPRLIVWMADPGIVIRYSGIEMAPSPWHPAVQAIRERVESYCARRFNGVLVNLYRDGQDSMGWHADDERELGPNPYIASLSLGAIRKFQVRHKSRKDVPTLSLELEPGSLLIMSGDTQEAYKHQVPKTRQAVGPRINLTFRHMKG